MTIREAAVPSTWKGIYNLDYDFVFHQLKLNGVLGIKEDIPIQKGIFAICGRNGVGKSTVLAALKDAVGISLSKSEVKKINGEKIELEIVFSKERILLENTDGKRFFDLDKEYVDINVIDYDKLINIDNYLEQDNLHELLEQFEEEIYKIEDLKNLSYLVGKEYSKVNVTVIEDDDKIIPYFEVNCYGIEYDSLTMGTGEHFLFYTYWCLKNINNSGAIILEEPEVFISVPSQTNLMNFIAKKMKEKKLTVLVATHSPFILQNIDIKNMLILNAEGQKFTTFKVNFEEEYLEELGISPLKKGALLFEDTLALEFFKALCKEKKNLYTKIYTLNKMNGHSDISNILYSPKIENMSYKIIGIYDGDMVGSPNIKFDKIINKKFLFLPGEVDIEKEFRELTESNENIKFIADAMRVDITEFKRVLSRTAGKEDHDWFNKIYQQMDLDISVPVKAFTSLWIKNNNDKVNVFFQELDSF